ncbi:MAG: type II toxin-antitoxin system VapB family antitoxin [Coriobacteriales bacterium]|nr:type II toxin-antitoxin system VapB family antitoxin [Coriobacteriales bacterium]
MDDELLVTAKEIGHFKTKRETVTVALQEFTQWCEGRPRRFPAPCAEWQKEVFCGAL